MRLFHTPLRPLTRPGLFKSINRMGSIVAPRELRTLAQCPQLALSVAEDDPDIRSKYRPFLLDPEVEAADWISQLELDTVMSISSADIEKTGSRLKVLVLYGSLRKRYATHILVLHFF
jgi:arsenical resistance protein ArsH